MNTQTDINKNAFAEGFVQTCIAHRVNPITLLKIAAYRPGYKPVATTQQPSLLDRIGSIWSSIKNFSFLPKNTEEQRKFDIIDDNELLKGRDIQKGMFNRNVRRLLVRPGENYATISKLTNIPIGVLLNLNKGKQLKANAYMRLR